MLIYVDLEDIPEKYKFGRVRSNRPQICEEIVETVSVKSLAE